MRHFAHHIGDYAAATAHLPFLEDAAYHRLLRLYYRDERPLPVDIAACQRLAGARTKDERAAIEAMLHEFFTLQEDGWHQRRADDEIIAYQSRADSARENGLLGGRPRTRIKPGHKPSRNQSGSLGEPIEKLTKNQEPVTKNQRAESAKALTPLPEDWKPDAVCRAYASDRGLDPDLIAEAFVDYWTGGKGSKQKRPDWCRTWRVWCDRETPRGGRKAPARSFDQQRQDAASSVADTNGIGQWRARMRGWPKFWMPETWGPEPGQPGCQVPKALLAEVTQ